ncbi:MAG: response regulator [Schlesneria sp.]
MTNSIEQVTDELLRHGILNDESMAESCHELEKRGDSLTQENLLSQLTATGKLTPFQAEEVRQGRANHLLIGNYLVLSRLGEGGMGTVYKALHRRMQRLVAIKVIRKDVATRDFITRFRREIQLLARLNHPNMVIAYDSDQCLMGEFLVMEYVEGIDLAEVLKRSGTLSLAESISAVRQAALALDYAHRQGIVHRDIKPANLLRDVSGAVKVVDLGLARLAEWEGAKGLELTQMGTVTGTVDYMSPEQAETPLSVDLRSDIYSLGCTLFYLLTGGPVFTKSSLVARVMAHRNDPPPKLNFVRKDLPQGLDAIFQKMVAKAPNDRYSSMQEVVDALDKLDRSLKDHQATQYINPQDIAQHWMPERARVLLVEQSRLQSGVIGKILAEIGVANVHFVATGKEALEQFSTYSPTVVLSSMKLSDMSGLELAARIRDSIRCPDTGIILMTGDDWNSDRQSAAKRLGRTQMIRKPFDGEGLRKIIEQTLNDQERDQQPMDGLSDLRVLIVDDSAVARRHAQETLTRLGFSRFTLADDGSTAIEELEKASFDLVVTDYNMPQMDGQQLITYIRQVSNQRQVPIIMVTTEFDPQKLAAVYQLGVSAICNKSFDLELVRNIVMKLFA